MIIIIDKNEVTGEQNRSNRDVPLDEIGIVDVIDEERVTLWSIQVANIFIVTDYSTGRLLVMKHRYNEELHGAVLPIDQLEQAIEDEFAVGVLLADVAKKYNDAPPPEKPFLQIPRDTSKNDNH